MDDLRSDTIEAFTRWARATPAIDTPRLYTRPLTVEDAEPLFDALKNPRVNRWISVFPQPFDLSAMRRWLLPRLKRMDNGEGLWSGVFAQGSTVPMGFLFAGLEADLGGVEIAGALGELYWGKGFVEEATFVLINDLFRAGIPELVATCALDNWSSMRILRALNFTESGQQVVTTPQGERRSWLFRLTKENWGKVRLLPLGDGLSPEEIQTRRKALYAMCREMKSARDYLPSGLTSVGS